MIANLGLETVVDTSLVELIVFFHLVLHFLAHDEQPVLLTIPPNVAIFVAYYNEPLSPLTTNDTGIV